MDKGTLILICGLPGSGKTTFAKKLEHERQANRLCPDDWILAILKDQKDVPERNRLRDPIEQLLWKEAQALLKLGVNVILENGFWSKEERDSYLNVGRSLGVKVELHFMDADFDVLWKRVEKRNYNPVEFKVSKKEMEDGYKVFQPPTQEEGLFYDYFSIYNS
jgi:predicted kinase